MSLDELTELSGLPKPTVFRILALLVRGGVVARESIEKRYFVGPRLSTLALKVQMHSPARALRHSILVRLVEEIGETCNFTMLDGHEVVYLDRVETSSPATIGNGRRRRLSQRRNPPPSRRPRLRRGSRFSLRRRSVRGASRRQRPPLREGIWGAEAGWVRASAKRTVTLPFLTTRSPVFAARSR